MGSHLTSGSGAYVGNLVDHARALQGEARDAIARGDYARAAALIEDAELLAEDVHGLVDDFEARETRRMIGHAAAEAEAHSRPAYLPAPRRSLRLAIGASIAMSLALVEC